MGRIRVPLSSHTFMGGCSCEDCEVLRCFIISNFEDYKWIVNHLNDKRNIQVNPMIEEEFDVSYKTMKSFGKTFTIGV